MQSPRQTRDRPATWPPWTWIRPDDGRAIRAYAMTRDASGTSWQPDSTPMEGVMGALGGWSTMLHGYAFGVYDNQGGPRGGDKAFSESMLMAMAQRPAWASGP